MIFISDFLALANNPYFLHEVLPFWVAFAVAVPTILILGDKR